MNCPDCGNKIRYGGVCYVCKGIRRDRRRSGDRTMFSSLKRPERKDMKNSEGRTTKPLGNRKVTSKVTKKPATSGAPRSSLGVYLSGSSTRKKELIQKRRAWRRQGKNATGNNLKKEQGVNRCRQALVARLEEYNRLFADIYARSGMLSVILRSLGYSEDDIIHLKHQIEEYLDELDDIRRRTPLTNTTSIEEAVSTAATTILQQHKKEH